MLGFSWPTHQTAGGSLGRHPKLSVVIVNHNIATYPSLLPEIIEKSEEVPSMELFVLTTPLQMAVWTWYPSSSHGSA